MARKQKQGRHLLWALIGGAILVAGIVAIAISANLNPQSPTPTPDASVEPSASPSESPTTAPSKVVDPAVSDRGWVAEPITTDADVYIRSALEAAATFDTQLSEREAWLAYLDTWFTPDTRYTSEADQNAAMSSSQLEMRQAVVLPDADWVSLAGEEGRVSARVNGDPGSRVLRASLE